MKNMFMFRFFKISILSFAAVIVALTFLPVLLFTQDITVLQDLIELINAQGKS